MRTDRSRFLVLSGACTLIVEGEERQLTAWDFFYCAPKTPHIIVAVGKQSAVVLAVGARGRGVGGGVVYTVCKAAARHGASVARETTDAAIAYAKVRASLPRSTFVKFGRDGFRSPVATEHQTCARSCHSTWRARFFGVPEPHDRALIVSFPHRSARLDLPLQVPGSASSPWGDERRHCLGLRRRGRLGEGNDCGAFLRSAPPQFSSLRSLGSPRKATAADAGGTAASDGS